METKTQQGKETKHEKAISEDQHENQSDGDLPPFPGGSVAYYEGRWEIWDESGEELLLAGLSAGKTVFPAAFPAEAGMWDGHGVVTEAREEFSPLKGRRISETGPVIFPEVPGPLYGTGIFVIY